MRTTRRGTVIVSKATKKRLAKLAGGEGIAVLQDLFNRLEDGEVTVPAVSFRVNHETQLECIQRLAQRTFIEHKHDAVETYRIRLISLVVIPDSRARSILRVCDTVLRYLDARFREDPDNKNNKVMIAEIVNDTEIPIERILEALDYLANTPGINPSSTRFRSEPEPYVFACEQSLSYGSLEPLVTQLANWVGTSAAMQLSLYGGERASTTAYDRGIAALKNHRVLAWILITAVGISGLSVVVASILYLIDIVHSWFA